MWSHFFVHNVGLVDYMKVLLGIHVVDYIFHVYVWSKWWCLWSHYGFTKYVWGYETSHVNCTSRLSLRLWVSSCDVDMIRSPSMLLLTIAYYEGVGSVYSHVVFQWVLYAVRGTYWFICEVRVLGYSMFQWMPMFK